MSRMATTVFDVICVCVCVSPYVCVHACKGLLQYFQYFKLFCLWFMLEVVAILFYSKLFWIINTYISVHRVIENANPWLAESDLIVVKTSHLAYISLQTKRQDLKEMVTWLRYLGHASSFTKKGMQELDAKCFYCRSRNFHCKNIFVVCVNHEDKNMKYILQRTIIMVSTFMYTWFHSTAS